MVTHILYEPLHHSRHSRPVALSYTMNFIGKQTWQVVIVYLLCKRAEMQLSPGHRPAEPNANTTLRQPGWLVAFVTVPSIVIKTSIGRPYKRHVPVTRQSKISVLRRRNKMRKFTGVHILSEQILGDFTYCTCHNDHSVNVRVSTNSL
jgi:hypothetical protein